MSADDEFWNQLHQRRRRTRRPPLPEAEPPPEAQQQPPPREHRWSRPQRRARRPVDRRLVLAAALTGVFWVAVMLVRLLVGGPVGLADQGDGRRLTCTYDVAPEQPWNADTRAAVYPTYERVQWWGESCGADGSGEPYNSTERWLLSVAKPLTAPLGLPGALDLRALGVVCSLLIGAGIAAWVAVLPGAVWHRVLVASLVGLVYADSLIAPWLVSAYSEPAAMVGILFLAPALLWLWRRPRATFARLALVGAITLFTAAAKTQAIAIVPSVIIGIVWTASAKRRAPARQPHAGHDGPTSAHPGSFADRTVTFLRTRVPALVVAVAMVVGSGLYLGNQPSRFATVQKYDAFFGELLPHSPNAADDLHAFGLPDTMLRARGTNISSSNAITRTPEFDEWNRKVTMPKIWLTYARDPIRLVDLGARGMHAVAQGRPTYLANYGTSHKPYSLEHRLPIFLTIFHVFDRALPALAAVWLMTLLWGWITAKNTALSLAERGVGRLAVVLVMAITFEFWATALTEGSVEYVKHMILTDLLTALCFPVLVALGLTARRYRSES